MLLRQLRLLAHWQLLEFRHDAIFGPEATTATMVTMVNISVVDGFIEQLVMNNGGNGRNPAKTSVF